MIANYLKIAWRNLMRNKIYAAINIAGLAVGIAVFLMIDIIIRFHTSFDAFHPNQSRIYRILTEYHHTETANTTPDRSVPYLLPRTLKSAFPGIEAVTPVFASHNDVVLIPDEKGTTTKKFTEAHGLFYTQPSFFRQFNFPLLAGSYESLNDRNTVLLAKETAEKYFGSWQEALGKTIKVQSGGFMFDHSTDVLKVTGILATIPANTDFQLKLVESVEMSYMGTLMKANTGWEETTPDFNCYILLKTDASANGLNRQLNAYAQKFQPAESKDSYTLQPLAEVHYDVQTGNYSNMTISRQLIDVLWLIAAFILVIAGINFVNLATAQAVHRSKEVGIRKVLGSNQFQLLAQFLVETFLIVFSATLAAVGMALIALPSIDRLLQLSIPRGAFASQAIIAFLGMTALAVTAFAGFYPAIVLSRFNPVTALKRKFSSASSGGVSLRRALVVFQFIVAQALIIGTLVIVKQMDFFMSQPLGFDKEGIINVPFSTDSLRLSRFDYLRTQLLAVNGVEEVSFNSNTPIEDATDAWTTLKFDHSAKEADFKAINKFADDKYIDAYRLPLVAGRNLKPSKFTQEFLVNESLMKSLGISNPDQILGKQISIWNDNIKCPVVGVLRDYNNRSFRYGRAPLLITTNTTMYNQAAIKLATANMAATMAAVKAIWEKTFPEFVFQYRFLDEKIEGFYRQERQLAQLYKIFAAIAIFLSCLGLYGLASFMTVRRQKEVGIRKTLGASAVDIVFLFSKEFTILIGIAFIIASPIAGYYMNGWLRDYVFRITIPWWVFAAAGLIAILIAFGTISVQAIKAARVNPVKTLRSE
ncbi:MAG TPA: ABC transporter permease [Puia sp.]|nr:ABC transporter permease [Puia sp.]